MIDHAGLVACHMLQKSDLLRLGDPLGRHWVFWQEHVGRNADNDSAESQDDKHDPPICYGNCAVANELEAEGSECADNLTNSYAAVPDAEPQGLLLPGVPLTANEDQARPNGSFEDTEEDSRDQESVVIVYSCYGSGRNAPQEYISGQPLGGRDFAEDESYHTRQWAVGGTRTDPYQWESQLRAEQRR